VEAALASLDHACAAELIERIISPRITLNEHHTLRRWIEQIPEEVLRRFKLRKSNGRARAISTSLASCWPSSPWLPGCSSL
jgi:hypothetical protein